MTSHPTQDLQLQEINLNDVPQKKTNTLSQVKQLKELTKQVLSTKTNDHQLQQSLDFIKQKISFDSSKRADQSYDGDQSFRNSLQSNFLDENESNYSSVSTVSSISHNIKPNKSSTPQEHENSVKAVSKGMSCSQSDTAVASSFIELWNLFKEIYMQEKTQENKLSQQTISQLSKQQSNFNNTNKKNSNINGDEKENTDYGFSIFSCLECFKRRSLPKNVVMEKNMIIYMYNTKRVVNSNNSNLLQKMNRFYSQVDSRTNAILQNRYTNDRINVADNLNVLANLFLIAFSDFHYEIFYHLLYIFNQAPCHQNEQKVPLTRVASIFTNDILYMLSSQRIDSQIVQRQSVINYINHLFFALMFCYFQECVRNNQDFGEISSKTIIAALMKQVNAKPDSIINYFTKRFPSFIIDKNFLKYI